MNFRGLEYERVGDLTIGVVTGFSETEASGTGLRMGMLVRSRELSFDAAREVADMRFSKDYFPYPCLGEYFFSPIFDGDGVVTELVNVNDLHAEGNPIRTGLTIATYAMFETPITERTPTVAEFVRLEDGAVTLTGVDGQLAAGRLTRLDSEGALKNAGNGTVVRLAPDPDVYTWDWTVSQVPFSRCTREEYAARNYPTRFYPGSLSDILRGCYWLSFSSLRGDESVCDMVNIFLNAPPGWV